jgi:hypothetical protein
MEAELITASYRKMKLQEHSGKHIEISSNFSGTIHEQSAKLRGNIQDMSGKHL